MTVFNRLALAVCAGLLAGAAMARDVTGEMTYRERAALADGAELLIELRGPTGIVAEARIATAGRQVPLPFTLIAPDAGAYALRGAIFVGGRAEWLSDAVAVPEGEAAVSLGQVALTRPVALGFSTLMRCGTVPVRIGFVDQAVVLQAAGETIGLAPVAAASGARYSDGATPETYFWSKGNDAEIALRGQVLADCLPVVEPPLLPLTARGNEPGWRLDLTETGYVYVGDTGATRREGPLPVAMATGEGVRFDADSGFGFAVTHAICRDSATGMPHPLSATVAVDGRTETGCGGRPVDLLAGDWVVEHVDGAVLPQDAEATIAFDAQASRVSGTGGCNRFNGGFTLTGEGLSFGPAASTMMACPQDLAAVEAAFLKGLEKVDRFDITNSGALELYSGSGIVIRARR